MNSDLLNTLGISREELLKLVVEKLADISHESGDLYNDVSNEISKRLNTLFEQRINSLVDEVLSKEMDRLLNATITPTTIWGEPAGEPTTIRDALLEKSKQYWETKVDRNGNPVQKGSYGPSTSRSEWLMSKLLQEEFDQVVKQNIVNVVGALKEVMREDIAKKTSTVLDELIRVKTK